MWTTYPLSGPSRSAGTRLQQLPQSTASSQPGHDVSSFPCRLRNVRPNHFSVRATVLPSWRHPAELNKLVCVTSASRGPSDGRGPCPSPPARPPPPPPHTHTCAWPLCLECLGLIFSRIPWKAVRMRPGHVPHDRHLSDRRCLVYIWLVMLPFVEGFRIPESAFLIPAAP